MCVGSAVKVDAAYFELAKHQCYLTGQVGFPHGDVFSGKGFAQKVSLAFVVEIAGFFHFAQFVFGAIFPFLDLFRHHTASVTGLGIGIAGLDAVQAGFDQHPPVPGDLHNALFTHTVHEQVCLAVQQDGALHALAPVVVMSQTPQAGFNTADENGHIFISLPDKIAVDHGGIVGPFAHFAAGGEGIGLAAVGVPMGYRVIIVMPDTMSRERIDLIKGYGAEVVLTDGSLGMSGAIAEAERLNKAIENSFIADQFNNPANAAAHYRTPGPEIWQDTDGQVDIFVAGVGTGGTLTGTARTLKKHNPQIRIVAVEPADSAVLSGGKAGAHGLQGIGAGFIPEILDTNLIDEVIRVTDEEADLAGRQLSETEGLLTGISSGAAVHAAIQLALRPENKGKRIVVLLPDTGERYLSTKLFMSE